MIVKPMLSLRSLVMIVRRNTLVKLENAFLTQKKIYIYKEHVRNVKSCSKGTNIANHAWTNNHLIDFENARVVDYRARKTLESWNIACEQALYSGGQRELFSLRAPKARVSANEVKASEASPR